MRESWFFRPAVLALIGSATVGPAAADDWPQWMGLKRDGVWRESGVVEQLPTSGPAVVWRAKIGAGYAGPAVADGKVIVTDRRLAEGAKTPANAFARASVPGSERVLCFEERTGQLLWKHEYDCPYQISYSNGPRCTPVIADGRVYTLGAMGHLLCLNLADGAVVWERDFVREFQAEVPLWGFSAHPLLDGQNLITLVGGARTVVAFDKDTGRENWSALDAKAIGYCPPVIYAVGGRRQLIIWHPESVNGLDPSDGRPIWSVPFPLHQSSLSIPMPRLDGDRLFVTSFYNSALMLTVKADTAEVLWRGRGRNERPDRTETLHSIMPTPLIRDGHIYGVCSYGQLRCLEAATGRRIWETMKATRPAGAKEGPPTQEDRWGNAFLVEQGGRVWMFNEHGELILAKLSPAGYDELGRAKLIEPDNTMARHPVVWSHPAFANRCVIVRNDSEIVRASLAR